MIPPSFGQDIKSCLDEKENYFLFVKKTDDKTEVQVEKKGFGTRIKYLLCSSNYSFLKKTGEFFFGSRNYDLKDVAQTLKNYKIENLDKKVLESIDGKFKQKGIPSLIVDQIKTVQKAQLPAAPLPKKEKSDEEIKGSRFFGDSPQAETVPATSPRPSDEQDKSSSFESPALTKAQGPAIDPVPPKIARAADDIIITPAPSPLKTDSSQTEVKAAAAAQPDVKAEVKVAPPQREVKVAEDEEPKTIRGIFPKDGPVFLEISNTPKDSNAAVQSKDIKSLDDDGAPKDEEYTLKGKDGSAVKFKESFLVQSTLFKDLIEDRRSAIDPTEKASREFSVPDEVDVFLLKEFNELQLAKKDVRNISLDKCVKFYEMALWLRTENVITKLEDYLIKSFSQLDINVLIKMAKDDPKVEPKIAFSNADSKKIIFSTLTKKIIESSADNARISLGNINYDDEVLKEAMTLCDKSGYCPSPNRATLQYIIDKLSTGKNAEKEIAKLKNMLENERSKSDKTIQDALNSFIDLSYNIAEILVNVDRQSNMNLFFNGDIFNTVEFNYKDVLFELIDIHKTANESNNKIRPDILKIASLANHQYTKKALDLANQISDKTLKDQAYLTIIQNNRFEGNQERFKLADQISDPALKDEAYATIFSDCDLMEITELFELGKNIRSEDTREKAILSALRSTFPLDDSALGVVKKNISKDRINAFLGAYILKIHQTESFTGLDSSDFYKNKNLSSFIEKCAGVFDNKDLELAKLTAANIFIQQGKYSEAILCAKGLTEVEQKKLFKDIAREMVEKVVTKDVENARSTYFSYEKFDLKRWTDVFESLRELPQENHENFINPLQVAISQQMNKPGKGPGRQLIQMAVLYAHYCDDDYFEKISLRTGTSIDHLKEYLKNPS